MPSDGYYGYGYGYGGGYESSYGGAASSYYNQTYDTYGFKQTYEGPTIKARLIML